MGTTEKEKQIERGRKKAKVEIPVFGSIDSNCTELPSSFLL